MFIKIENIKRIINSKYTSAYVVLLMFMPYHLMWQMLPSLNISSIFSLMWKLAEAIILVYSLLYVYEKRKFPIFLVLMFSYFAYVVLANYLADYSINDSLSFVSIKHVFGLTYLFIKLEENNKSFVKQLCYCTEFYCLLNIILQFVFPNDWHYWLLGVDNMFIYYYLFALICSFLYHYQNNKLKSVPFLIFCAAIQGNLVIKWTVTGMIGVIVLFALIILFNTVLKKVRINMYYLTIVIMIVFVLFVVLRIQANKYVADIIYTLFKKSATLSGRNELWQEFIKTIVDSKFRVHGYINDKLLIDYGYTQKLLQPHNYFLFELYCGGIVGVCFAVLFIILISNQLNKNKKSKFSKTLMCFVFSLLLVAMAENMNIYTMFSIYIICFNADKLINKKDIIDS